MTTSETLALIEGVARIMRTECLDAVHVSPTGEVRVVKSIHGSLTPFAAKTPVDTEDDEDVLYHSADN